MSTPPASSIPSVPDPTESAGAQAAPGSAASEPDVISFPSGKELNDTTAIALATSRPVRWVVIAGQVDSGKTTLLTSLYELFQWASVGKCRFAGSLTLPGFELRCHLSRLESGNLVPKTQRTLFKDLVPSYVHLRFSMVDEFRALPDLLFTDVSGEMFEHVRDSIDECRELTFLRRAGNFVLLLDGEKAVRAEKRWGMVEDARGVLRACLDSEMLAQDCRVDVVWSKVDFFEAAGNVEEHSQFRKEVEREFIATFGGRSKPLTFSEIAARPTLAPHLGFGKGVPELLKGWVADCTLTADVILYPEPPAGTRESELFAKRHRLDTGRA